MLENIENTYLIFLLFAFDLLFNSFVLFSFIYFYVLICFFSFKMIRIKSQLLHQSSVKFFRWMIEWNKNKLKTYESKKKIFSIFLNSIFKNHFPSRQNMFKTMNQIGFA